MPLTIKASSLLSALASLILAWPAVGSAADEAKVTNIAPNPGAEKGQAGKLPEGWSHYRNTPAKAGITEKVRHGGKRSAYLKVTGFGKDGCAYTGITVGRTDCIKGPKAISVKPNTKYYFSFFIKGEGFAGKIIVKPCGFKSNGGSVDQDIPGIEVIPKTGWLRHMGSFITGAETEQVVLMFHVSGLKNRDVKLGAVFYIDDVCFGINESDAKMELLGWRGEAMAKDLWMIPDNFARKIRHISDEELFEAMDLTRPGMEDISKAVKSRDYTAAYRAWAAYWERMHQEKPTPPATQESPGESRFDLAAAIMRHEITGPGGGVTIMRCVEIGFRGFLVWDEGVLYMLNEMKKNGNLPEDLTFKVSIFAGHGSAAGAKVLQDLGAGTFNPIADISPASLAAIRRTVNLPMDIHIQYWDAGGGFNRIYETPDIARVSSPCYFKMEPGPGLGMYSPWGMSEDALADLARLKIRIVRNIVEIIFETYPDIKLSEQGPDDLRIPKPERKKGERRNG